MREPARSARTRERNQGMMRRFAALAALMLFSGAGFSAEDPYAKPVRDPDLSRAPWLRAFTPKREFYVSPAGGGTGVLQKEPMGLAEALKNARPGDRYWLLEGKYEGWVTLENAGEEFNPIVWRAMPGQRATMVKVILKGAHNWLWGVEVTDPAHTRSGPSGSIVAMAPGAHIINNVIHDTLQIAIGGWNNGPGHVYYGNITYRVGLPRRQWLQVHRQQHVP